MSSEYIRIVISTAQTHLKMKSRTLSPKIDNLPTLTRNHSRVTVV